MTLPDGYTFPMTFKQESECQYYYSLFRRIQGWSVSECVYLDPQQGIG